MPVFRSVRHFVYEKAVMKIAEEAGFLKKGTGKDVLLITVAFTIPWKVYVGMYNVGLYATAKVVHRVISPRPRNLMADTSGGRRTIRSSRPATPNYGIARIGGGIHSPFMGAFIFAPPILTGASMFRDRFGSDPGMDAM